MQNTNSKLPDNWLTDRPWQGAGSSLTDEGPVYWAYQGLARAYQDLYWAYQGLSGTYPGLSGTVLGLSGPVLGLS